MRNNKTALQNTINEETSKTILSCIASTQEEYQLFKGEFERWNENVSQSVEQGSDFCDKVRQRLEENGGIKFKPSIDRLYFNDDFSFEAIKFRNKENSDKLDVLIRIQARNNDGDVQPNLLNAVALFGIDGRTEELELDVRGEGILKDLEPDVVCRFVRLTAPNTLRIDPTVPIVEWRTEEEAKELIARMTRERRSEIVCAAASAPNDRKTCRFISGNAHIEATILSNPCGCYVMMKTDSSAVIQKTSWFVFGVRERDTLACQSFTFNKRGVAEAIINVTYSDGIVLF